MKSFYKGFELEVLESVYEPAEDSYLLSRQVDGRSFGSVLDVGTGCGIQAILAAKSGNKVKALDINPVAVRCARKNARTNHTEIDVFHSNLFENVNEKFDAIIFNPPYVPAEPDEIKDGGSLAWDGGKDGNGVILRFLKQVPGFLNEKGRCLLVLSSLNKSLFEHIFSNFKVRVLDRDKLFFEELLVLELRC